MKQLGFILLRINCQNRSVQEYLNYELHFQFNNLQRSPDEQILGLLSCQQEGSEHKHGAFDESNLHNIVVDVVVLKM